MTQELTQTNEITETEVPSGYKKTKYGIFPDDWEIRMIKDILKRVKKPVEVQANEDYKQIGIRSHGKGIFYKQSVTGESLGNKAVFWIEPDCFIVNIVFAWEMAVAKTTTKELGFIASHRFPMYKPEKNRLDLDFITYLFKSPRGKYLLNLASPGGAGRNKTLGQKEFGEIEVVIPQSVNEQKKIAEILSTWDKAIELKENLIEQKKEQKKGVIQKLLTGNVRVPGWKGKVNEVRLIGLIKEIKEKNNENIVSKVLSVTNSRGFINQSEQFVRQVASENLTTYKIIRKGQFAYNPSRVNVGSIDLLEQFDEGILSPMYVIFKTNEQRVFSNYLKQFFKSNLFLNQLEALLQGSVRQSLSFKGLEQVKLFIPDDLNEQKQISEILSLFDKQINLLQVELKEIQEQKKWLMQMLLTGKIRVKV
ncbi:restriction endonuclease subunit S [Robertmurraya sp. DFI.2.37]|uniref:restriction endonuclease subunit S n=1 Tax=Robertmurraya sp. DFI.2.37 TaxID=3031819 RepID=UPI00124706E4|nr:restriction endonuclease subunit S [Robertmurraya sp. DFI.2.37]MDF1510673.1 restriction endonuclease subunit S [Robertmurraya sp. DFI.2.37]